jgi:hypothetical protein
MHAPVAKKTKQNYFTFLVDGSEYKCEAKVFPLRSQWPTTGTKTYLEVKKNKTLEELLQLAEEHLSGSISFEESFPEDGPKAPKQLESWLVRELLAADVDLGHTVDSEDVNVDHACPLDSCSVTVPKLTPTNRFCSVHGKQLIPLTEKIPKIKTCASCSHDLAASAKFCTQCGHTAGVTSWKCPGKTSNPCDASNALSDKFCASCGMAKSAGTPSHESPLARRVQELEDERKDRANKQDKDAGEKALSETRERSAKCADEIGVLQPVVIATTLGLRTSLEMYGTPVDPHAWAQQADKTALSQATALAQGLTLAKAASKQTIFAPKFKEIISFADLMACYRKRVRVVEYMFSGSDIDLEPVRMSFKLLERWEAAAETLIDRPNYNVPYLVRQMNKHHNSLVSTECKIVPHFEDFKAGFLDGNFTAKFWQAAATTPMAPPPPVVQHQFHLPTKPSAVPPVRVPGAAMPAHVPGAPLGKDCVACKWFNKEDRGCPKCAEGEFHYPRSKPATSKLMLYHVCKLCLQHDHGAWDKQTCPLQ